MNRERALKVLLVLVGLLFVAGIYPLVTSIQSHDRSDYPDQMILAIYITLGVFLLLAVRDVSANRSLIAFTGWSSLAHASVMIIQSFQIGDQRTQMLPLGLICVVSIVLLLLMPRRRAMEPATAVVA